MYKQQELDKRTWFGETILLTAQVAHCSYCEMSTKATQYPTPGKTRIEPAKKTFLASLLIYSLIVNIRLLFASFTF
jgi:hypothetical protein